MNKTVKIYFWVVSVFLLLVAIVAFALAIIKGYEHNEESQPKIQVYINDNDSVVNQLQMDVSKLIKMIESIESIESDSIIVEVKHVNK